MTIDEKNTGYTYYQKFLLMKIVSYDQKLQNSYSKDLYGEIILSAKHKLLTYEQLTCFCALLVRFTHFV